MEAELGKEAKGGVMFPMTFKLPLRPRRARDPSPI